MSQGRRNLKSGILAGNIILNVFWNEKGIIVIVDVLPREPAVNSGRYA